MYFTKLPTPGLKRLFVHNQCYVFQAEREDVISVTEETLESLIKNVPSLTSMIIKAEVDFVSAITHQFMVKMIKDENVVVIVDPVHDRRDKYQNKMKTFFEKKGSDIYNKWKSMKTEYVNQLWFRYSDRNPY